MKTSYPLILSCIAVSILTACGGGGGGGGTPSVAPTPTMPPLIQPENNTQTSGNDKKEEAKDPVVPSATDVTKETEDSLKAAEQAAAKAEAEAERKADEAAAAKAEAERKAAEQAAAKAKAEAERKADEAAAAKAEAERKAAEQAAAKAKAEAERKAAEAAAAKAKAEAERKAAEEAAAKAKAEAERKAAEAAAAKAEAERKAAEEAAAKAKAEAERKAAEQAAAKAKAEAERKAAEEAAAKAKAEAERKAAEQAAAKAKAEAERKAAEEAAAKAKAEAERKAAEEAAAKAKAEAERKAAEEAVGKLPAEPVSVMLPIGGLYTHATSDNVSVGVIEGLGDPEVLEVEGQKIKLLPQAADLAAGMLSVSDNKTIRAIGTHLQYGHYGFYGSKNADGEVESSLVFYQGLMTPESAMPQTGLATYAGKAFYNDVSNLNTIGESLFNVDFGAKSLTGVVYSDEDHFDPVMLQANIVGNRFIYQDAKTQDSMTGIFLGPNAEEMTGRFDRPSEGSAGTFGAARIGD